MPNHVTNRITLSGDAEQIEELFKYVNSVEETEDNVDDHVGGSEFDFNNIIPMPESLRISSSSLGDLGMRAIQGDAEAKARLDKMSEGDRKDAMSLGKQYIDNMEKYGVTTWYDWAWKTWGTKWNAYEVVIEDNVIEFETAWAFPFPVIEKLSEKFPMVTLHILFADADTSYNVGSLIMRNGEIIEDECVQDGSKEAYEIFFELKGGREYYKLVDGNYEFDEEAYEENRLGNY